MLTSDNADHRSPLPRLLLHSLAAAVVLSLAGCGGGGGSNSAIPPSVEFQGRLLVTNGGASPSDWDPATCTEAQQKNWVRSNLNEDYLFYRDAPLTTIEPTTFAGSVIDLFDAYTTDGLPLKDRFSFVLTQAEADAAFQAGTATGIGVTFVRDPATKKIRIAFVDPNGPAFTAGLRRGMQLQSVNNTTPPVIDGQQELTQAQFNALFASPEGTPVTVGFTTPPANTINLFSLATATYDETPVLTAKVLDSTAGKVGYLAHTSFVTPIAETQLADAFKTFAAGGVTNLVVDLRYNGGGYIFIASQLAYMVAGRARSANKTFEAFVYNDKRSAENQAEPFRSTITNFLNPGHPRQGEALTQLNLSRVYVLATGNTCSASEAFVSALRGVDVEVVMVGSTSCGKPYGFSQENNCTLSYFPLEFEGRNHKGQVVPVTGLTPTESCATTDDLDHELGDTSERMLAFSLSHITGGACTVTTAATTAKTLGQPRKPGALIEEQEFVPAHRTIQLLTRPR
jgi:C-terminal processing protease CtpA/Prc